MGDENNNRQENLKIYELFRSVPKEAQKPIQAGNIKGFTDINPMWRIKCLTEAFGPAGIGWYTEITRQWLEPGKDGKTAAFCNINLYVRRPDGEWSAPIIGTGGSAFVNIFKGQPATSDEAYKMAYTDAIGVACKALGIGADIYWSQDRTKYNTSGQEDQPNNGSQKKENEQGKNNQQSKTENQNNQAGNQTNQEDEERLNREMTEQANAAKIDAIKVKVVREKMQAKGVSEASIAKYYKISKIEEMRMKQWSDCMTLLDRYQDKKQES